MEPESFRGSNLIIERFTSGARSDALLSGLVDMVVVVLGLFLGLQVDSWWEQRQDAATEAAYLLELREDFEINKFYLEDSIAECALIISDMSELIAQSALTAPTLSVAELNEMFSSIQSMPTFMPVTRAYDNLTGSGDLKILRNRELKNLLSEYYARSDLTELVQNTHEMALIQLFQPYTIEHLNLARIMETWEQVFEVPTPVGDGDEILGILSTPHFRNVVMQKWYSITDLHGQHDSMLEITNEALALLE